jgi:predicted Zn-dependent protease
MSKRSQLDTLRFHSTMRIWRMICRRATSVRKSLRRVLGTETQIHDASANSPLRRIRRFVRKSIAFSQPSDAVAFRTIADVGESPSAIRYLNPYHWLKWSALFAINWLLSRPFANIPAAIPAIGFGSALVAVVLLSGSEYSQSRVNGYRSAFDESVKKHDYQVASVILRSLIESNPQNVELQYQQALLEELRGNVDQATKQMDELATMQNHGLAAMWTISKESNLQELKHWSGSKHARFRQLVEIGLKNLDGENLLSAKVLMFSYLAEIGAYSDAGRYLSEVVPARPELSLAAAALCRSQHDTAGVERYAAMAVRHFESELSRQPQDINTRINFARALMIRKQFEDAAKLLNDGYRLTKDSRLAGVTGEALLVWSNHLGQNDPSTERLVKRLQILHAAVRIAPTDPAIGSSIAKLLIECRDSVSPEVSRLKSSLLAGTDPVSTHFIRGTLALLDNKYEEAKSQLELALNREPNVPAVLNNLAVALAEMKDSELEKALSFVNLALTKQPNQTYFLETRGQILVKMKRWHEAISDLEVALEAKELRPAIYPSLALAYERIGATDLTLVYRNLASESQ